MFLLRIQIEKQFASNFQEMIFESEDLKASKIYFRIDGDIENSAFF